MKKRLLSVFLAFCMLYTLPHANAVEPTRENSLSISADVNGAEICLTEINGENYLFLPASADLHTLSLHFTLDESTVDTVILNGEKGSVSAKDPFDLTAIAVMDNTSRYILGAETPDGKQFRFYIMQGAAIPTVYLYSGDTEKNRNWVDSRKDNETIGRIEMVRADGTDVHSGALTQIKGRGNTTFRYYPKKSYQMKLKTKADLLGSGENVKTWVLLAVYNDATMMHDKLFKDMAARLGMNYAAGCDWVNLYYDGEYRGVYLLSEKNSIGSTSVDITDMEEAYDLLNEGYGKEMVTAEGINHYGQKYQYAQGLTEPESISGGYLIEQNHNYLDEASGFHTAQGVAFNVKSPEWAGQEAMEYISEYYQAFENAVYATDAKGNCTGYNTETRKYYYEYCDLESLVQTYLIQQLSLNVDAYTSSFFFYKDVDGLMYAGPVWDMDSTCGTGWSEEIPPDWEFVDLRYLGKALSKIPSFQAAVEDYFTYTFAPEVEKLLENGGRIAEYKDTLSANATMNYVLWPYVKIGKPTIEGHLWPEGTSYNTVTRDMKAWLSTRLTILDKRFGNEDYKPFTDVADTDWEYEAVRFTVSRGLFNGVTDERFGPDGNATRGMLFTVLARMAGEDTTPGEGEHWQQPGLDWAVANGISDGTDPGAPITREQMATMLWRYEDEPISEGSLEIYTDGAKVSTWAADAMKWAVAEGIFRGDGSGILNPNGTASRAEIAQVIMNFMTK